MSKESCEKIIRDIAVNIATNLATQSEKIRDNQNKSLALKWKKSDLDDDKYILSLKSNILFYKVSIRNKEGLIRKWIETKNIPDENRKKEEIEVLTKKCMDYVQRGIKSGGNTFNKVDVNILNSYNKLDNNQAKIKLEEDYKTLNLYNEVLNFFINDLIENEVEEFFDVDSKEIIKLIKVDIVKATNFIKKNLDKLEEQHKEKALNDIESKFIKVLSKIESKRLFNKMKRAYEEACAIEEIEPDKGFGFDIDSIKNFICSTVLLDLANDKEVLFLNGALRLLIGGEFGASDYSDFVQYIIIKKVRISKKVYDDAIKIIENNHQSCINNQLSEKSIKSSQYIDIDEYIYILENTDSKQKYNKKQVYAENEEGTGIDEEASDVNDELEDEYEVSNTSKKGKKIALVCLVVAAVLAAILGYLYGIGAFEKEEPEVTQENQHISEAEVYEEETENSEEEKEYIVADSNIKYLTEDELEQYSVEELGYIRNEIFARYGYIFEKDKYRDYFYSKSWYTPNPGFEGNEEDFNEYELANIELIKSLEAKRKGKTSSNKNRDYFYIQGENPEEYYAIYTEAYNDRSDAESYKNTLSNKKVNAIIREEDSLYKVQVGDTIEAQVAKKVCEELEDMKIDTYILGYSSDYDLELDEIKSLAEYGYYEQFTHRYENFKKELEDRPLFKRYEKLLDKLYEEYESYL